MSNAKQYNTKQRELIFRCVRENGDRYVTIRQISEYLERQGIKVGLTTIYRTIEKLLKEEKIASVSIDGVSGKCYKYLGGNEVSDFFPMKCEECGNVVKIHCSELKKLYEHLRQEHRIHIDSKKIMFYGICDSCKHIHIT